MSRASGRQLDAKARAKRRKNNLCVSCGKNPCPAGKLCADCRTKASTRLRVRRAAGLCTICRKPGATTWHCQDCKDRESAGERERRRAARVKALTAYGGRCRCCGETEPKFLVFDHINNDGAVHRRELRTKSATTL